MPISALPTAPARTRPTTFSAEMDAFLPALSTFRTEANALAVDADADAASAAASALAAAASETVAIAVSGAVAYSPASTYNVADGDAVFCTDGHTYRCLGTGVTGDNPITSVTGNWLRITGVPLAKISFMGLYLRRS